MKGVGAAIVNAFNKEAGAERSIGESMGRRVSRGMSNGLKNIQSDARSSMSGLRSSIESVSSSFDHVSNHGHSLGQRLKAGTVALGMVIGNAVSNGVGQMKDFAESCVQSYNSASIGVAKFHQIARDAGWSQSQQTALNGLASSLSHVGVVSAGVTRAGETQLGTFKLDSQAVATLTPALDDMIAHTKGVNATTEDAVAIGNLMGKVMTGSTSALARYGVTMTKAQKATLEKGSADQRAAMLAKILEQNYGGVNRALAQTPAGKIKELQNNFAALKVEMGQSFTSVVGAIAPILENGLTKAQRPVQKFCSWFVNAVNGLSTAIKTGRISDSLDKAFGFNSTYIISGINNIRGAFRDVFDDITGGA